MQSRIDVMSCIWFASTRLAGLGRHFFSSWTAMDRHVHGPGIQWSSHFSQESLIINELLKHIAEYSSFDGLESIARSEKEYSRTIMMLHATTLNAQILVNRSHLIPLLIHEYSSQSINVKFYRVRNRNYKDHDA